MASVSGWRVTRAGIGFVVVLLLLGLAVFGVVTFIQQRGEQARREEAAKIAQDNLDKESDKPVTIAEDKPDQEEQTQGNGTTTPPSDGQMAATGQPTPGTYPETGINPGQVLAVVALATAGTYYLASRRAARGL